MIALDDVDRRMIDELRADGRKTVPALAEALGIGRATAYTRFDRLVDTGAISGFRAEVRPAVLGLTVAALVLINVVQRGWRAVQQDLTALHGIEWVGLATGPYDFIALVRAEDLDHLRDTVLHGVQSIEGVRSAQTIVLLDEMDLR